MFKNLLLLAMLSWVGFIYAKHPVEKESMDEAKNFKVEKASPEQEAQRAVAGSRIKKKKWQESPEKEEPKHGPDSEVRYWQYSE